MSKIDHEATARSQQIILDRSGTEHIPDGIIKVSREGRWLMVRVGRARYVKRFNLTDAEARQLVAELAPLLNGEGP